MTNEERMLQICECLIDIVQYLPPGSDWIEEKLEVIKDIEKD